jgi:hypothetical protein
MALAANAALFVLIICCKDRKPTLLFVGVFTDELGSEAGPIIKDVVYS